MRTSVVAAITGAVLACMLLVVPPTTTAAQPASDANATSKTHQGFPTDWSSRQVVMTGGDPSATLAAGVNEPRQVYNLVRRMVAVRNRRPIRGHRPSLLRTRHSMKVDWSVSLENGFVQQTQSPAKFSFDVTSENCNNDYVLFAISVLAGKPAQGTVIGINNLYTGGTIKCNGGTPWVAFAYNTVTQSGGQIKTSPTISIDGTKAAFVESSAAGSFFHVLALPNPVPAPPTHLGTVLSPQTPTSCATPTTVGCMTTVQISAAANSLSSPWIDYSADTAYVGTDDGKLYKIAPVFSGGTPALVSDTNWPVTVVTSGTSKVLTGAVEDPNVNRIFVGDGNGFLYAIDLTSPAHAVSATQTVGWVGHGAGTGIVDPPLVVRDSANPTVDQVFAVTGCSNIVGIGGAINQLPGNFTSATTLNAVDLGSADGGGSCTTNNVHLPMFDNAFWTGGSTNGHIIGCGFVSGTNAKKLAPSFPKMYMFPFTNNIVSSPATTSWQITTTKGDECSPLTEFSDGTTDRLFFGVGNGDGFIKSSSITAGLPASSTCSNGSPTATCVTAPKALGGTSGIIIDNEVSNGGTNIYFTTLAPGAVNGGSCAVAGGTANPYCAEKLTQSALQ